MDRLSILANGRQENLKKINQLIRDIERDGNAGIGKPEPLIGDFAGFWSRRINSKDRLIYRLDENNIYIIACRYQA
ncbi:MAG: Txe/YoeB family addiction module toxin [Absicoccus porci]|nr:Txe/YoeB family addiction module toxin [Absicoccus porci]MCI6088862.1 Txe/YoeB family addiction module toxin [Absicoccus porci]MDD7331159.1 Txe/YoeB family addiction module toxin [Absicoccus porci]MDY4738760.1 Txe/YoeB family addiction module toxin [Absicoccus porci]